MKKLNLTLVSLIVSATTFAGDGWVHPRGGGYFKLAQNMIRADYYFAPDGTLIDLEAKISLYTSSLYGEFGITDRFTLVTYVPFFVRSTLNKIESRQTGTVIPGDAINSFGDTDIGIKYGFLQNKPVVMAASLTFGLPLGNSEVTSERILQTGDGEFNQLLKLEAGHSFYPAPFYATAYIGFNNRTKDFSDEFRYGAEFGFNKGDWLLNVKVNSVNSLYNGADDTSMVNAGSGTFANNMEFFGVTPEAAYFFTENLGVTASAGFAFSGKRILAEPNFGVGVFWEL